VSHVHAYERLESSLHLHRGDAYSYTYGQPDAYCNSNADSDAHRGNTDAYAHLHTGRHTRAVDHRRRLSVRG